MRAARLVALVVLVAAVACGDDSGASDDASVTSTSLQVEATTPTSLPEASPGSGTLVLDGVTYEFAVGACELGSTEGAERGEPITLFRLTGEGVGPGDEPFTVRVSRIFVRADTDTFTDTIVFQQPESDFTVVAERVDSDGLIIDLKDPSATTPLLRLGDDHVSGSGTFGPSGGTTEDRTLPGTLSAGCPT